ncbi:MAG: tRNA epoxyqueuosine(34) reductase QueG [Mariprofundaceae bacterium]|nr:tRNA epoxyqueuosine(34) reductase QueG [Mariprofundaceae bacterium]
MRENLTESIREKARENGFEMCRIARVGVGELHRKGLSDWVQSGMHGDMAWMAEKERLARRKNPESMLDGVKSVISLGMRYSPPPYALPEANAARSRGVISAYAHGDDYHEVMKKRLKLLACDLDGLLGAHDQRVYVDTAPVLEHAFAETSGLGWQGKHSLTLNRQYGSWFLLGEIFTTADLAPDTSANFHCGSCTACIDVCPTKAIVAPFSVDARLCISYLTIEFKGFIPHRLRPLIGNRIYGCDDCQLVCPWNGDADMPDDDILKPRGENIFPELVMLLRLDETGFRERFRKSPVKRTGRVAFLRNICIAMGNAGDVGFIPPLMQMLNNEAALLRAHSAWALARLAPASKAVFIALQQAHAREKDQDALADMNITIEELRKKT